MTESRSLTDEERDRLRPELEQTEIPMRVTDSIEPIEDVIELHGEATGWRSGDRRIVLSSRTFDRLENEQLRALLAHEIGHHRGRHPLLYRVFKAAVLVCAVPIVPAGLYVGLFFSLWAFVLYAVGTAAYVLAVIFGGAWVSRGFELDADRRAVELLGSTEPLEALVRPGVTEPPTGLRDRVADWCYPWPRCDRRLATLDRPARGGCHE